VSACILQEAGNIMELKKLIEKATMIYEYIKVKSSVVTYMQVKPPPVLVEKHVDALGFEI